MRHILVLFGPEIVYRRIIHERLTAHFVSRNGYLVARYHLLNNFLRTRHGDSSRIPQSRRFHRLSRKTTIGRENSGMRHTGDMRERPRRNQNLPFLTFFSTAPMAFLPSRRGHWTALHRRYVVHIASCNHDGSPPTLPVAGWNNSPDDPATHNIQVLCSQPDEGLSHASPIWSGEGIGNYRQSSRHMIFPRRCSRRPSEFTVSVRNYTQSSPRALWSALPSIGHS
jgi:hypothetical protein